MPKSSLALSNLRAFVIIVVLFFHSVLAYLGSLPATADRFDAPPYDWQINPIIDNQRWFGFDLFCAWHDVYLMSLMFFLSGLFVWPSLLRKRSWGYLRDRLLRLALPLVLSIYVLMPIALYPSYRATAADPSLAAYWQTFMALPFWPCGPQWFLWQLLALNIAACALCKLDPGYGDRLARWAALVRDRPALFFTTLSAASALAYVPLALLYSPWSWFQYGPFAFQWCRPLHYTVYFFAGLAIGAHGLDRGVLATDGPLARHWLMWLAVAFATFCLWIGPTAAIMEYGEPGPVWLQIVADLGFALACAGGGMFVLAVVLRFATARVRVLDSLSDNAYGMYLVHYMFVVWLQYSMLGLELPAVVKAATVFGGTLVLSWGMTAAMRCVPLGSRLIGTERRAVAETP